MSSMARLSKQPKRMAMFAVGRGELRAISDLAAALYAYTDHGLWSEALRESLETTLRRCIAFCYNVTPEWAPHVRVTVYADNVSEHQLNVPVLSTLLCCMGERGFEAEAVPCKPIPGTDVHEGVIRPSVFWTRLVSSDGRLHFRSLAHSYLKWFVDLEDTDSRKQLLVNILLQMHEACYNCVGRHKEVFEFCIYDLMTAEQMQKPAAQPSNSCHTVIFQHAARFLDRHKRNALHAAYLSPLKYMFQHIYEVYENLDSHGSSFWVAVLSIFFPDLNMPFERIEQLDTGWGWAAVDFLPSMSSKPSSIALERFSNPENLGRDWRSLTRDLPAPSALPRRFRYLPLTPGPRGFEEALRRIHSRQSVRQQFARYVERFTSFMQEDRYHLGIRNFAFLHGGLVAKRLLPAGNSRDYAMAHLEDEFEATDVAKRGVLSVMESLDLLQNLAVPGLTCADLGKLLEKELGLEVPRAELHKYFTTMDVNGDGLLQDEEFIQVVRFLMLDYYPHHILKHLNLSLPQIALFMSGVLAAIGVVFLLVTLVISFFEVGEDIGATLHGGFSGIFGVVGKRLSDEGIGFEDTMKNLELRLEAMMVTALVTVLGLSKEMQDVFSNVIASAEARLV
ncbi:hypothetical protein AK812_SmicGene15314 [Symbiodinium microadriaticum]|uniref:EF-hand domain-containing protein n=1 Tax=Symbiodinium microadriaticum TaxID=2951 RepID=A0A1Q9E387_SYMMI|nr:hypothetical protein AK812_SmicGene15314 [Symbiodinium microadriaticum]